MTRIITSVFLVGLLAACTTTTNLAGVPEQKPVSKATIKTVLEEASLKKAAEVMMESIEVEVPGETRKATEPLQVYTEMPNEL